MDRRRALVVGVTGQDGAYLSALLLSKGYRVFGGCRSNSRESLWRLRELGIEDQVERIALDLLDYSSVESAVAHTCPDEVYNLAGHSFVGSAMDEALACAETISSGVARLLKALDAKAPSARFLQASSSELFGLAHQTPQTEATPFRPRNPYGLAKLYAHELTRMYREFQGRFACSAILYNHESPLRGHRFVTQKVATALARLELAGDDPVQLGGLDSRRDWGDARDYVLGMWLMLQQEVPEDYVLATGQTHSVRELVEVAARHAGFELTWEQPEPGITHGFDARTRRLLLVANSLGGRSPDAVLLVGDAGRARAKLGWTPSLDFDQLIGSMVCAARRKLAGPSSRAENEVVRP